MKERDELILTAMEDLICLLHERGLTSLERNVALACALTACRAITRVPPSTQDEISIAIAETMTKELGHGAALETLSQLLAPKARNC
jgi:hypothetical protein